MSNPNILCAPLNLNSKNNTITKKDEIQCKEGSRTKKYTIACRGQTKGSSYIKIWCKDKLENAIVHRPYSHIVVFLVFSENIAIT